MSRNSRGKVDKTSINVVFRLQFHATHIPQARWNNLFISVVPSDSRKATSKTNKANVRNGICKWVDPIYETTMLLQDSQTKQYDEKLYRLLVAMGPSRSSLLGEANINLSNYVDASSPTVVALPLRGSNSGGILHVAVQLLTSEGCFRELEQHREIADRGLPGNTDHGVGKLPTPGEAFVAPATKVNRRVRLFKPEPKELLSPDTATGSDGISNSSRSSLYSEKRNNSRTRESECINTLISSDPREDSPSQSPTIYKGKSNHHSQVHVTNEWGPETSKDKEMVVVYEENNRLQRGLEAANLSLHEMQEEISRLLRELDESNAEKENLIRNMDQMKSYYEENQKEILGELQNLRHEHSSCIKTISSTKSEILELSDEKCSFDVLKINKELERRAAISEAALRRTRMNYSISVNQLQKDLDVLSLQAQSMFETNKTLIGEALEDSQPFLQGSNVDQSMEPQSRDVVLKIHHVGPDRLLMDRKMQEELSEIHLANINLDIFSVILHQALLENALDSREEMHDLVEQLESSCKSNQSLRLELQNLSNEICTVIDEKANAVSRSNDLALEKQTLEEKLRTVFGEKCVLSEKIKELESLVAECKNLKSKNENCYGEKAKLKSDVSLLLEELITMKIKVSENEKFQKDVNYIQERLENLLVIGNEQVNGSLPHDKEEANTGCEKFMSIIMRLEESLRNFNDKILQLMEEKKILVNERDVARVSFGSIEAEIKGLKQEFEHEALDMASKLNSSSLIVEKLQTKFEAVINKLQFNSKTEENFTQIITRDLLPDFTKMEAALQDFSLENTDLVDRIMTFGSVYDELEDDKLTEEELSEMHLANVNLDLFAAILHQALLEAALENQTLEAKLRSVSDEKCALSERIEDLESLVAEFRNYKSKYETCDSGKHHLSNEVSLLQEEVMHTKTQVDENEKLQKVVNYIQEKLENLLVIGDAEVNSSLPHKKDDKNTGEKFMNITMGLEECLQKFNNNIIQIMEEKRNLLNERDAAHVSFASLEAEVKVLKQEFDNEVLNMVSKLNVSSALVEKLRNEFEVVKNKVRVSSEAEEKCTQMTMDLLSDFTKMQAALEVLTLENRDLVDKIKTFGSVTDELEDNKLTVDELKQENLGLEGVLDKHGTEILDLNGQLKETNYKLAECDLQVTELTHLKQPMMYSNKNHKFHIEEPMCLLRSSQTEIEDLILSKEELEIKFLILQATIDEFKNLSNDVEKYENRKVEESSFVSQESLRIAFIKEEYEAKLQEINRQLSISEKHGEEILLKLQDALDDLERRKKCEATQLKRNEDLALKIQDLEGELEMIRSEIREKFIVYEQMKAELDCSVMSLDCCKEEKRQLVASLQECDDYRCKLGDEVEMLREQVENFKASMIISHDRSSEVGKLLENSPLSTSCCKGEALEGDLNNSSDDQIAQEALVMVTKATKELSDLRNSENGVKLNGDLIKDQLKPEFLSSIIEHLQKELEQMKSENTVFPDELVDEISQRDQVYLEKVSEDLQNMSSLYCDSSQAKSNPSIKFQSSFLIKDMVEMKERYGAMETELKELHERYSQLSLNFAEVEGERQKLTLILKSARPSKKILSRSSTFSHKDQT